MYFYFLYERINSKETKSFPGTKAFSIPPLPSPPLPSKTIVANTQHQAIVANTQHRSVSALIVTFVSHPDLDTISLRLAFRKTDTTVPTRITTSGELYVDIAISQFHT
jgi:hypothetical protein